MLQMMKQLPKMRSKKRDFDQNGLLLKIATNGIAIQDYVKRLKESDILVAVDGEVFLDGPAKLNEKFNLEAGDEAKWLLTFWRDGELFDLLLTSPFRANSVLRRSRN